MKPVDKKDLPKLIALIVLAAGVFGFFIVQMAAPPPAASQEPATTAAAKTARANSPAAGSGAAGSAASTGETDPESEGVSGAYDPTRVVFSPTGRDPFTPNGAAAALMAQNNPVAPRPTQAPTPSTLAFNALPNSGRALGNAQNLLSRLQGTPGTLPESAPAAAERTPATTGTPVILPPPAAPDFDVTGVVLGEGGTRSVAILRGAENERRFVMVGDPVGNGFVVSAIHANGIDVRDPSGSTERVVTIKLGNTESSRAN